MNKIKDLCVKGFPYLTIASATMAKWFMFFHQPLNLTVCILNFAMLLTLVDKKDNNLQDTENS